MYIIILQTIIKNVKIKITISIPVFLVKAFSPSKLTKLVLILKIFNFIVREKLSILTIILVKNTAYLNDDEYHTIDASVSYLHFGCEVRT